MQYNQFCTKVEATAYFTQFEPQQIFNILFLVFFKHSVFRKP